MASRLAVTAVTAVTAVLAAPAAADWLVMLDGSRVETSGAWKVKGRQVVFTQPGGALAALRLADVNLEASAAATRVSRAPAAAAATVVPAGRRKAIMVLTNESLGGGDDPVAAEAAGEPDALEDLDRGSASAAGEPVQLVSWNSRESTEVEGLEIVGSVRNTGDALAAAVRVSVTVPAEEETSRVEARAFLQYPSLGPGQSSRFRALLPGVFALIEDPIFEVTSEGITIQGPQSADDAGDGLAGDEDFDYADLDSGDPGLGAEAGGGDFAGEAGDFEGSDDGFEGPDDGADPDAEENWQEEPAESLEDPDTEANPDA